MGKIIKILQNIHNENDTLERLTLVHNLDDFLDLITKIITENTSIHGLIITLTDEKQEKLIIHRCKYHEKYKNMEKVHENNVIKIKNENDYFALCFSSNENLIIHKDDNKNGNSELDRFGRWNIKHEIYIPISSEQEKIGVICLYSLNENIENEVINDIENLIEYFFDHFKMMLEYYQLKKRKKEIDGILDKNSKVLNLANRINNLTSISTMYKIILKEVIQIFNFDVAAIFIEENNFLHYLDGMPKLNNNDVSKAFNNYDKYFKSVKGYEINTQDGATGNAFLTNNSMYFKDLSEIMHLPMAEKDKIGLEKLIKPKTLLLMPIVKDEKPIGVFQLFSLFDNIIEMTESDIKMVKSLCEFFGTAIKNSQLYTLIDEQKESLELANLEITRMNSKLIKDLNIAKKIQEAIIKNIPDIEELSINSIYLAMESLGGDLFDVRKIGKYTFSFMISDVSGHGVPAALITTMAKTSFINHSHFTKTPEVTCREVNCDLYELIGQTDYYLTAFYSMLDINTMTFSYANCGHTNVIVYKSNTQEVIELISTGMFIGIMEDLDVENKSIQLDIDDKIVFFTDGISEARNENGDFFTYESLLEIIKNNGNKPSDEILKTLLDELSKFCGDRPQDDDRAILIVQILQNYGEKSIDAKELVFDNKNKQDFKNNELIQNVVSEIGLDKASLNYQIKSAIDLYKQKEIHKALDILHRLYKYFDSNLKLLNTLGVLLYKNNDIKDALFIYNKIKRINPDFPNINRTIEHLEKKI